MQVAGFGRCCILNCNSKLLCVPADLKSLLFGTYLSSQKYEASIEFLPDKKTQVSQRL